MNPNPTWSASADAAAIFPFQPKHAQRILVVEPDPFMLHLSAEGLIRHGYEVNAVENGAAAWEELQAIPYQLLITDYDLPGISGLELIKRLRAAQLALPVVLVVGSTPPPKLDRDLSVQLAATLRKPIAVDALLDTVNIVLRTTAGHCGQIVIQTTTTSTNQWLQETSEDFYPPAHWGLND